MTSRTLSILLLLVVLPTPASPAEWQLWPDFAPDVSIDQSQTEGDDRFSAFPAGNKGLGQTFRPRAERLHRIDVQVRNRGDERAIRFRLWRWLGSRRETEASPPLFEDVLGAAGIRHTWHTRSVFPDVPLRSGALYYFRLDAHDRGPFQLRGNRRAPDRYPAGQLVASHLSRVDGDLWFRSWTRTPGAHAQGGQALRRPDPEAPFSWSRPDEGPTRADATAYLRRVQEYAAVLRRERSQGCGAQDHHRAYFDAFLYALSCEDGSCDESLARNAIERLVRAAIWRSCELPAGSAPACVRRCRPGKGGGFEWLDAPSEAYALLSDSPSWTPPTRRAVRGLLVEVARDAWPKRELGTGARALESAAVYLRLARLFPEEPDAGSWRQFARSVWDEFRRHYELQGASAFYNAEIAWPQVLGLAELNGDSEALWEEPRFLRLVERAFDEVAPLGVLSGYGDATGWAIDGAGLVWLFEEAARRTGDGRYRWLAQRIFAYNAQRARPQPPRHDTWYRKLHLLARAYRSARAWQGAASPPTPLRETVRARSPAAGTEWRVAPDEPIGQTFTHPGGTLVRIDLRARQVGDGVVRARLWPWRGDLERTRAGPPAHSARLEPGPGGRASLFPLLSSRGEQVYYLELGPESVELVVSGGDGDPYPGGRAFGVGGAAADLWFESHGLGGFGSVVTERLEVSERPMAQWGDPKDVYRFSGERVPDKLVLRSGSEPEDLFALVTLTTGGRHAQPGLAAFSTVLDGGAVLLSETSFPYWHYTRRPEEENLAMVRRYQGGRPAAPGRTVEVARFQDTRNLTVAWLRHRDVEGWGVGQERRVYFVKNRLIWIRDRFDLPADMRVAAGSVWHADRLLPPHSPAEGHRVAYPHPLRNAWPYHNPLRFARLWMPAHPDTVLEHERMPEHAADPACEQSLAGRAALPQQCRPSPSHALHRRWTGHTGEGRRVWIDTVLVPEGSAGRSRLEVLQRGDEELALAVTVGGERWVLLDNPKRRSVAAGGLVTDALYAFLREGAAAPYVHVAEATRLEGLGHRLVSETPSSTERNAFAPTRIEAPGEVPGT